jgi:hypothetical protein
VKADQDAGDVGSPTKSEDHTSSSILEGLQARNDDIRASEQDAVAVVKPRKDKRRHQRYHRNSDVTTDACAADEIAQS